VLVKSNGYEGKLVISRGTGEKSSRGGGPEIVW